MRLALTLILCGMLDEDYLSAYSPQKRQACLLHVGTGKLLWQPRGSPVLLGRAAKKAVFARLKAGTTLVRGWQGLSVGSVDRKILAQLKQCSR